MPAETGRNELLLRIAQLMLRDVIKLANHKHTHSIDRPDHPLNLHQREINRLHNEPRIHHMYYLMRRALWNWPEFHGLSRNARRMLDTVLELAREEGFPWYVSVAAENVVQLAGFDQSTFKVRRRELECLAITRPARRIHLLTPFEQLAPAERDANGYVLPMDRWSVTQVPTWPSRENNWRIDPHEPIEDISQWVIRYRHGRPGNKRRAAWWINYDLLCGTQRVLPCFEMRMDTLSKTYLNRNYTMGAAGSYAHADGFTAMERMFAEGGPVPLPGLRAALWDGMD